MSVTRNSFYNIDTWGRSREPRAVFSTLFSSQLTNGSNKLEFYIAKRLTRVEQSSLLGQLLSYEEIEVLWICSLVTDRNFGYFTGPGTIFDLDAGRSGKTVVWFWNVNSNLGKGGALLKDLSSWRSAVLLRLQHGWHLMSKCYDSSLCPWQYML